MLKFALLGFLSYLPMSGYDLEKYIEISTGHFWHAKLSQIYTTLKGLEADGLVTSDIEPQADRPDRRVYTLTEAGHAVLREWLQQTLTSVDPKKDTLLLKLFFAAPLEKSAILTQLRLHRDLHHQQMLHYQRETSAAIEHTISDYPHLTQEAPMWEATRRFGELYEEMYVRWLDETIRQFENE